MPQRISIPLWGPSNTLSSVVACADETIDLISEPTAPGTGKTQGYARATPGLSPVWRGLSSPVRGLFSQNDRGFAATGYHLIELFADGTTAVRGAIANDLQPVSFAGGGNDSNQLMLTSGGLGYVLDLTTNGLHGITASAFPNPARLCEFMNGYFLALKGGGSRQFNWSALEDATTWNSLDFAARTLAGDNLVAFKRLHDLLYLNGFATSEVWYDQGQGNTVFAPYNQQLSEFGQQGPFTLQRVGGTLMWMSLDARGNGQVLRGGGSVDPIVVSTFAVSEDIQRASTPTDALAFSFQMDGHLFYALVLPRDVQATWLYDATLGEWTKWAHWNAKTASYEPHRAGSYMFCFNQHFVGDRLTGTIYRMGFDIFDDELTAVP